MKRGLRLLIGLSFAVLAGGAYFAVKAFTGKPIGAECNSDDDCKGLNAVCMIGDGNSKYCTISCTATTACPTSWACEDVTVTNVDGSGNQTSGGTTKLCSRPAGAPAPR